MDKEPVRLSESVCGGIFADGTGGIQGVSGIRRAGGIC